MKARITWDAGWGECSTEVTVAGIREAVSEAVAMVEDQIDSNLEGPAWGEFQDALFESEVEVVVRVKSAERDLRHVSEQTEMVEGHQN